MNIRLAKTYAMIAIYLLAAVIFLIVPIPSTLLDVMMAFNISIALITILFNCIVCEGSTGYVLLPDNPFVYHHFPDFS